MSQRAVKDIIRDAIDALGVTQSQFAKALGVDPATVSRWLKGTQVPRSSLVALLANNMGVDEIELWRAIAEAQRDENSDLRRERDKALRERDEMAVEFKQFLATATAVLQQIQEGLDESAGRPPRGGSGGRRPPLEVQGA